MALTAGVRLGPYAILSALGAGGMGEVYRARDTRLERDVAVKVLPAAFAADPDRLARFEREARVLASVNHPNIATVYGFEQAEQMQALVMELVEGEMLTEWIRTPEGRPLGETVAVARQIADALDAAHERGIVHRDLKPANIKITPGGTVKVLDFGLAKAVAGDGSSPDLTHSPTIAVGASREGVILGTAAYMSPEQARGKPVDKRTDIWAFGCVLYEMLTGRTAFAGETLFDMMAAILQREPDWTALPPGTPECLRRLLRRCLQKDARHRLRDIGDARDDIDESRAALDAIPPTIGSGPRAVDVEFQRLTDFVGNKESPAVSPDGKMVAFVAMVGGRRHIWVRLLAGGASLQVTRDDVDHDQPRWSPDSTALICHTPPATPGEEGAIWEMSALGGPGRRVAAAIDGGDVSHDGRSIAVFQASGNEVALVVLARDGSRAQQLARLPAGDTYTSPRWAPDDRTIAFQRASGTSWAGSLGVVPAGGGEPIYVARPEWLKGFCWRPDGSGFVYASSRGSASWYPPVFGLRRMDRDGQGDRQLTFGDQSYVEPDIQRPGALVSCRIRSQSDIWKVPVAGSPAENTGAARRITRQTGRVQTPSASPDDSEIVYLSDSGGHTNLWVARTDGSSVRQITFERDPDVTVGVPSWSPAGNLIAFVMGPRGQADLWVVHPDGGGLRKIVESAWMPCWSGDGRWLYFRSLTDPSGNIRKLPIDGGSPILVRREAGAGQPAVPADGSGLYYVMPLRATVFGVWGADHEVLRARPEDGPFEKIGHISGGRVAIAPGMLHITLSPDGRWLAVPLSDGATSNIWALPTAGGPMRPTTDFGDRSVLIARSVSWSQDSQHVYAAVAETETDIVLFGGLIF